VGRLKEPLVKYKPFCKTKRPRHRHKKVCIDCFGIIAEKEKAEENEKQ
jgi:hypothetical protein